MKIPEIDVDYRGLTPSNITSKPFRHILLLIFWPVFGALFAYVERGYDAEYYYPMYCELDELIPFNELFLIPYLFWFAFVFVTLLFLFLFDVDTFARMMKFIIITYGAALVVFFVFPNCQHLRPATFERDNILTRFISLFYIMDTNTNVCPSIHVIGSFAAMLGGLRCKHFQKTSARIFFTVTTLLICLSTVFLKQHSVIDVIAALPVCACGYLLCFCKPCFRRRKKTAVG